MALSLLRRSLLSLNLLVQCGRSLPQASPIAPTVPDTHILYQEPDNGRAAVVSETVTIQDWQVDVKIGNQEFKLTVDTGSSDLWVYGPDVSYSDNVNTSMVLPHTRYHCVKGQTSTCESIGSFNITYLYGFGASGNMVKDWVNIGDAIVPMGVEVANKVGTIATETMDGFIGLGFQSLNAASPKQKTFMELLEPRLKLPVFTIDFRVQNKKPEYVALLEFGHIDYARINGELSTASVDNSGGSWRVPDISFIVGDPGKPAISISPDKKAFQQAMIFDSGGSGRIDVDPRVLSAYYAQVANSIGTESATGTTYTFPCKAVLPDLTLNIGNGTAIYRGSILNPGYDPKSTASCSGPLASSSNSTTQGGDGNMGAPFFAYHYVVFSIGRPKGSTYPYEPPSVSYAPLAPYPPSP